MPLILLRAFWFTLILFLFIGWFLFSFIFGLLVTFFGTKGLIVGLIVNFILFIIAFFINYYLQKKTLIKTQYKFYWNRIEYEEGFLVKNRKTITYDKISNIGQRKGIIEGFFGLGTIYIDTPGSSPKGHELSITYLENPDQVYDWISKVVSKKY